MVLAQKQTHRLMEQNRKPRNGHTTLWSTNLWQSMKEYPMVKVLQQMVLGKPDISMQKNETGPLSCTIYNNKFKMDEDLNVRHETIKILEENTGSSLFDPSHSNFLLDMLLNARKTKANVNYWNFIKIKTSAQWRKQSTKLKGSWWNGRRYL